MSLLNLSLFASAKEKLDGDDNKEVLDNLRELVRAVEKHIYDPTPRYIDTMFFPSEDNVEKLKNYLYKCKKCLKICIFNFTNNQLRNAVLDVWDTGAEVFIITDDETMKNRGNDIQFLVDKGIPVRTDNSE